MPSIFIEEILDYFLFHDVISSMNKRSKRAS